MQRTVEDEPEPREPRDPGVLRQVWAGIVGQVSDAGALIDEVTRKGIRFLRSSIGRLPLFTSTRADVGDRSLEVDESHYFLVPYRKERALTAERGGSDWAESLERLGDDIDRESSKASSGLWIVGGVVALINPLVGCSPASRPHIRRQQSPHPRAP